MKKEYILYVCLLALSQSFCANNPETNKVSTKAESANRKVFTTTLDSLQGVWHPEDATSPTITISNHDYQVYTGNSPNKYYKIYFSDVLITEDNWANVSNVDLNATTGFYCILVDIDDNTCECYEMSAVFDDGTIQSFNITQAARPYQRTVFERP